MIGLSAWHRTSARYAPSDNGGIAVLARTVPTRALPWPSRLVTRGPDRPSEKTHLWPGAWHSLCSLMGTCTRTGLASETFQGPIASPAHHEAASSRCHGNKYPCLGQSGVSLIPRPRTPSP